MPINFGIVDDADLQVSLDEFLDKLDELDEFVEFGTIAHFLQEDRITFKKFAIFDARVEEESDELAKQNEGLRLEKFCLSIIGAAAGLPQCEGALRNIDMFERVRLATIGAIRDVRVCEDWLMEHLATP
jgi:hypothetical protein